ncbi:MAG TPA: RDD family protein [Flavobacteriales bacterium]
MEVTTVSATDQKPPADPVDPNAYPELGTRVRSIMVDSVVLIALMFMAGYLFEHWRSAPDDARMWVFVFIWFGYETLAMAFGATVGNAVAGIRCRMNTDESRTIGLFRSFIRYSIKLPLGWLAFLTMGKDPKRRALHDLVAGTVMVKA